MTTNSKMRKHVDNTSVFEIFLFDIQTDTTLTVNQAHTIALPAAIEGKRSGAKDS